MTRGGYGIPLICPKCPPQTAHRQLKIPGSPVPHCPDCGTELEPVNEKRRESWRRHKR